MYGIRFSWLDLVYLIFVVISVIYELHKLVILYGQKELTMQVCGNFFVHPFVLEYLLATVNSAAGSIDI